MITDAAARKQGHAGIATLVIGLLATVLALSLDLLSLVELLDGYITSFLIRGGLTQPAQALPPALLWVFTGILAFGLAAVILNISSAWRRLLIWFLTFAVTVFWAPVLLLSAHKPEIGVVLVGVLWSGFCAMVYTYNHEMPADKSEKDETITNDGTR